MDYDVIVIGAGAAGLMTAIQAARGGARVLLLEGQKKPGAKILMSGGTRCNVTNKAVTEKDFNSERIMCVRHILRGFTNADIIRFFKEAGVEMVLEPTGKYFPSTHSGKTILEALLRQTDLAGARLLCSHKVASLHKHGEEFTVQGEGFEYHSKAVVITTGGLSYPSTGSDGTGYRLAQSFGHTLIETAPALTPLTTNDGDWKSLSGITLDVKLTLWEQGQKRWSGADGFLFTHIGFSGPAALDISRHYLRAAEPKELKVSFLPGYNEQTLQALLLQLTQKHSQKTVSGALSGLLPQRLAEMILKKSSVDPSTALHQLTKPARQQLTANMLNYPLDIAGVVGYSKAEVTAGGIDWTQLNPRTLESKLVGGLFFAGEVLDVDGRIGGFNFQWAWSSGYAVARALKKEREFHE